MIVNIDITNGGSKVPVSMAGLAWASLSAMANLGSAVIEVKRSVSGVPRSYDTAQTLSASTSTIMGLDVVGVDEIVLEVTTPDASGQEIAVEVYGEEI